MQFLSQSSIAQPLRSLAPRFLQLTLSPYLRQRKVLLEMRADLKRLKAEHTSSVLPLQTMAIEAYTLESRVSDLVNAAYGLTPDEIALMWSTAPPRMPLVGPRS